MLQTYTVAALCFVFQTLPPLPQVPDPGLAHNLCASPGSGTFAWSEATVTMTATIQGFHLPGGLLTRSSEKASEFCILFAAFRKISALRADSDPQVMERGQNDAPFFEISLPEGCLRFIKIPQFCQSFESLKEDRSLATIR